METGTALSGDPVAGGILVTLGGLGALVMASVHILRTRDDVRSAAAWLGIVWLVPVVGLLLYLLFGINRIQRRAVIERRKRGLAPRTTGPAAPEGLSLADLMPGARQRWQTHDRLAARVSRQPLTAGNRIVPLIGGRAAYAEMIAAIDRAERTVALTTYIFQADAAGRRFVAALSRAKARGVEVRVLVDAVGNLYGFKPVTGLLKRRGVPVAAFNPARFSWRLAFFNLRTHRKLLIVDGTTGFAGGMNIRRHHLEGRDGQPKVMDTHFRLDGPIVTQLTDAFADDWTFSTGEVLDDHWYPLAEPAEGGHEVARAIADGPDARMPRTATILESAIASARRRVLVVTPYFMPPPGLTEALRLAALRGIEVDILVPWRNNLPLFNMAMFSSMAPILATGCRLHLVPGPFDHSKLTVIDGTWALVGSSNWDARSLRLNFEFNVETYGAELAAILEKRIEDRIEGAKEMTLADLKARPVAARALGRVLWLMSPYL